MATKYRIVEEGYGVYIEHKQWLFWVRETKRHSPSSAWASPVTTDRNYGTVEMARKEIDRRLTDEAKWVPRITHYPTPA